MKLILFLAAFTFASKPADHFKEMIEVLKEKIENRDGHVIEEIKEGIQELKDWLQSPVVRCFAEGVAACGPAAESGVCDENNADYNPVACGIKLNLCLEKNLEGIEECAAENSEALLQQFTIGEKFKEMIDDLIERIENRDGHVIEEIKEGILALKEFLQSPLVKCFAEAVAACGPAAESGLCDENNADYNPIACAIKLNKCLDNNLSGIEECAANSNTAYDVSPYVDPAVMMKCFLSSVLKCVPVQLSSQFCVEDSPNFNPIVCAIQLNICLINEMPDIFPCIDENSQ